MERITDITKVSPGDFVSFKGKLSVVVSLQVEGNIYIITLDNDQVVKKQQHERLEFFRTIEKLHLD